MALARTLADSTETARNTGPDRLTGLLKLGRPLVMGIVKSPAFQMKKADPATTDAAAKQH